MVTTAMWSSSRTSRRTMIDHELAIPHQYMFSLGQQLHSAGVQGYSTQYCGFRLRECAYVWVQMNFYEDRAPGHKIGITQLKAWTRLIQKLATRHRYTKQVLPLPRRQYCPSHRLPQVIFAATSAPGEVRTGFAGLGVRTHPAYRSPSSAYLPDPHRFNACGPGYSRKPPKIHARKSSTLSGTALAPDA